MLESLRVQGYALIDSLEIDFADGLNVLTGETGAGKSILIGALSLILGERGDATSVRSGNQEAAVSGIIRVEGNPNAIKWLTEHAISPEEDHIIIRRVLRPSGRGQAFIQSTPVTLGDLKELTSVLFDLHGQHEHQSLLKTENHRILVDRFGELEEAAGSYHEIFLALSENKKRFEEMKEEEKRRERDRDYLGFALNEIEAATLEDGEEEELNIEKILLSQREKLFSVLGQFQDHLAENRGGALAKVRLALNEMKSITGIATDLSPFEKRLETSFYELEDIAESVRSFYNSVDFSPERLEACEDRLALIRKLQKKYGSSIAKILEFAKECRQKLDRIENWDAEKKDLELKIENYESEVRENAVSLSDERAKAASSLEKRIQASLENLGMPKASFRIDLGRKRSEQGRPVYGPYGMDRVEFLISANPGEPPRPLNKIASGGEMSRVMLAIKSVLAETDHIQSLIFDEIDAGIGGEVAVAVGEHLNDLGRLKQVLCITHLATIAVRADNQIMVQKSVVDDRTLTRVKKISGSDRVQEIARMLAGDIEDSVSLSHAEQLLQSAGRL